MEWDGGSNGSLSGSQWRWRAGSKKGSEEGGEEDSIDSVLECLSLLVELPLSLWDDGDVLDSGDTRRRVSGPSLSLASTYRLDEF